MVIGITGATGFIGRHLVACLAADGYACVAFSRRPERPVGGCRETRAFAAGQPLDLTGLDAMVHLAGESVMGWWTAAKRERILSSRVASTSRIVQAMGQSSTGSPRVLLNASAIGYYGDRGDEVLTESAAPGTGFLADVTQQWEAAARAGEDAGLRVARVRIGFVLGRDGGAWPLLRRIFRLALGGRLGSGRQWMSLVHVDDVTGMIAFLLRDLLHAGTAAGGVFNAVGPEPVRNADFTRVLAQALHRPVFLPAPEFALRPVLGQMAELLLMSERVVPEQALKLGYCFRYPTLEDMLGAL